MHVKGEPLFEASFWIKITCHPLFHHPLYLTVFPYIGGDVLYCLDMTFSYDTQEKEIKNSFILWSAELKWEGSHFQVEVMNFRMERDFKATPNIATEAPTGPMLKYYWINQRQRSGPTSIFALSFHPFRSTCLRVISEKYSSVIKLQFICNNTLGFFYTNDIQQNFTFGSEIQTLQCNTNVF